MGNAVLFFSVWVWFIKVVRLPFSIAADFLCIAGEMMLSISLLHFKLHMQNLLHFDLSTLFQALRKINLICKVFCNLIVRITFVTVRFSNKKLLRQIFTHQRSCFMYRQWIAGRTRSRRCPKLSLFQISNTICTQMMWLRNLPQTMFDCDFLCTRWGTSSRIYSEKICSNNSQHERGGNAVCFNPCFIFTKKGPFDWHGKLWGHLISHRGALLVQSTKRTKCWSSSLVRYTSLKWCKIGSVRLLYAKVSSYILRLLHTMATKATY